MNNYLNKDSGKALASSVPCTITLSRVHLAESLPNYSNHEVYTIAGTKTNVDREYSDVSTGKKYYRVKVVGKYIWLPARDVALQGSPKIRPSSMNFSGANI